MAVSINYIAETVERVAPKSWAEEWDNVGLLVGDGARQIERLLLTLDPTVEVVEEAVNYGAQMILAHHPIMFRPLKNLRADNSAAEIPLKLIQNGIAYFAAHTNLDQSDLSSAWALARSLSLQETEILSPTGEEALVKLAVFVPEEAEEKVRSALVSAGIGQGITGGEHSVLYSESFFRSSGEGMFRPLPGSNPAVGKIGELTRAAEVKLESILPERLLARAVKALKKAHPYEEPAYDLIPLRNRGSVHGYGVVGYLPQAKTLEQVWQRLRAVLSAADSGLTARPYSPYGLRWAGSPAQKVRKVAIVNGSGGGFVPKALAKGADLFIAGDIDHHRVLDALQGGLAIGDIGHFLSEAPMLKSLADYLKKDRAFGDVEIMISAANGCPWNE
ncbi:GTP cyclohydrolase 1 type 2/Nif3 [Acididesulfobacillus acetoxydans]|uniref:GTP cyclohydrolase 1 type 2 homolog n=1 Tax=Acididesulfobacillus acetoxydans TaxID=1561005 RepID=A0A8S0Y4T4_9FIRM|nr:Nif3-like dinuclear metal center hexameric protein [Acididesulfobacillus acetoxydans]CAA7603215.1 GTP cyclohydrolase 1 type 2/Nif3 [Acididesulfobacillus acetoxydans]